MEEYCLIPSTVAEGACLRSSLLMSILTGHNHTSSCCLGIRDKSSMTYLTLAAFQVDDCRDCYRTGEQRGKKGGDRWARRSVACMRILGRLIDRLGWAVAHAAYLCGRRAVSTASRPVRQGPCAVKKLATPYSRYLIEQSAGRLMSLLAETAVARRTQDHPADPWRAPQRPALATLRPWCWAAPGTAAGKSEPSRHARPPAHPPGSPTPSGVCSSRRLPLVAA